jgi:hypothetical protein
VQEVLASGTVAPLTTRLECARRADGAAALIVASPALVQRMGLDPARGQPLLGAGHWALGAGHWVLGTGRCQAGGWFEQAARRVICAAGGPHLAAHEPAASTRAGVAIRGGGEASGPLWWPPPSEVREEWFSAGAAAARAYADAGLGPADMHYWGLYDCFPVCLIRWAAGHWGVR